jgi:predicted Zn-dependent protease with MMP-like domain
MADLVRDVVVHEIGHYFGLDDETMDDIEHDRGRD